MTSSYRIFDTLKQSNAQLLNSTALPSGVALACWHNLHDRIVQAQAGHHTLSLYIKEGYQSYYRSGTNWRNGGGPDRMCLMPEQSDNTWDIRGPLTFVHLYFSDRHLRTLAEQTWDRSPARIRLDERLFVDDPRITTLYRQFLLTCDWQDASDRLQLSSSANLLLAHLLKHYTQYDWGEPRIRGGLAPWQQKRVIDYIESHLDQPIQLADLAEVIGLSEYHFARMFHRSLGLTPHQYLTDRRLDLARRLLTTTSLSMTDIALQCGFGSSSHFSNRFRQRLGCTPSSLRKHYSPS